MNLDLIFVAIFYGVLFLFYLKHKNRFEIQNKIFALYKTKIGIKSMGKYSKKFSKLLNLLGYFGIITCFLGMIFILYIIIKGTIELIRNSILGIPVQPVLAPVLPGISILPGLPVLSFWHWIIVIFIVAVIHEFSHGIFASLYHLKIKSSGFAFLGPILAAFVEPDEKSLNKKSKLQQLSILSAGPFSNILFAIIILLFFSFIFLPIQTNLFTSDGVTLISVEKNSPADLAKLEPGIIITGVNNNIVNNQRQFINAIQISDGETIELATDKGNFLVKPEKRQDKFYLGVTLTDHVVARENVPGFVLSFSKWFNALFFWLWVISLGIGLFNLLPLGPVDGGRMLFVVASHFFENKKAMKIFKFATIFCLALIIINLLPYLIKLFNWLFTLFS